jgi:hypothetical protein
MFVVTVDGFGGGRGSQYFEIELAAEKERKIAK